MKKRKFLIIPVEGKRNEVEIIFQKDFKIKVDKKDKEFVKFLLMVLYYTGANPKYFAPLLGVTTHAFYNMKKKVESEGIKSLFEKNVKKKQPDENIKDADIGKIVSLIVKYPKDTNKKIADKFNTTSKTEINFKVVERIRERFGLKTL